MQMIYFLSMPFDLDCVLEYLWNLKPKHTHTPPRSRHYLLNQNLQGWRSGIQTFLKCHRKQAPSTYKCWECKLIQSLEINLAVISLLGIFAIDNSRACVKWPLYRTVDCSIIDSCQRLETTCKCIRRGLVKLIISLQWNNTYLLKVLR